MATDTAGEVYGIICSRFRTPSDGELRDDLDLGPPGFGLDSIAQIELLIVCEDHFGIPFPATLFDGGPLTVGRLVEHVHRERQGAQDR